MVYWIDGLMYWIHKNSDLNPLTLTLTLIPTLIWTPNPNLSPTVTFRIELSTSNH